MCPFLSQTIVLARNGDADGWMEILVLVVIAIFWAVGGILKAKANKQKSRIAEEPAAKPPGRPIERARGLRKQPRPQVQPVRRKVMRPRPVGQKPTVQVQTLKTPAEQALPLSMPQVQPKFEELPELEVKLDEVRKDMRPGIPTKAAQSMESLQPLLDFDEPESLTRAILHYEILGKPLSLRGPSEHIIGL